MAVVKEEREARQEGQGSTKDVAPFARRHGQTG